MKLRSYLSSIYSRVLIIYGILIVGIYTIYMSVFAILVFLALITVIPDVLIIFLVSLYLILVGIHSFINLNLVREERFPYELLRHQLVKTRVFIIAGLWFIVSLLIGFLVIPFSEGLELATPIITILAMSFAFSLCIALPSTAFVLYTFSSHKEARLCFKWILEILQRLSFIERKRKFVNKNLRWIKLAFSSCSSFLAEKPFNLELKEKEQYCNVIYTTMLIGSQKEIEQTSKNIDKLLISLGSKESDVKLREFLVALRCVAGKYQTSKEKEESLVELSDMWKPSSELDRFKARIKSPITVSIVAILTMILAVLALLFQAFKG